MTRAIIYGLLLVVVSYFVATNVGAWPWRRRIRHIGTYVLGTTASVLALIPLFMLVSYLVSHGAPGLNETFFSQAQKPLGEPGSGMKHAILGSLVIVGLASLIGTPIGVFAGIYLAERGTSRFAQSVRFLSEVMTGLPSIIAGILAYSVLVVRYGFSGWSGAMALSVLMIPVITRVTEESIRLVPAQLREASLGLGADHWRTVTRVILPAARSGILTGIILAIARVGGETAPLLFTAVGQNQVQLDPRQAMSALPLSIYTNQNQAFEVSQRLAVSGALFLVIWIGLINFAVRWISSRMQAKLA